MKLAPYPQYKDSGQSWLGEIPAHWADRKLRNILTHVSIRNRPDLPLLSLVREKGVIKHNISSKEENHNYIPDDLSNYKVVRKAQFAMNKMNAWQGSYGVSDFDGIVSPAYLVFDMDGVEGDFFHVAIRSKAYVPFFTQASDGVRVGQWDLNQTRMKEIPFFLPSPEEQTQIARFLDWKTAQINKFIRNKQRLIELFKEQKQHMINQAITRGLNPNANLKPSGMEWIGDIPEHWEVRRARTVIKKVEQGWSPAASEGELRDGQWAVLTLSSVNRGEFRGEFLKPIPLEKAVPATLELRERDFLITRSNTRDRVGDCCIVEKVRKRTIFSDLIYRVNLAETISPKFLALQLLTNIGRSQIEQVARGSSGTMPKISHSHIKSIRITFPPLDEQENIVTLVETGMEVLDQTITRAEQEIELIREYRTRLISDVVTGQVDVQGIEVPEVAEEELLALDEEAVETDGMTDNDGEMKVEE